MKLLGLQRIAPRRSSSIRLSIPSGLLLLGVVALTYGCAPLGADGGNGGGTECRVDRDCPQDMLCERGQCQFGSRVDGSSLDAGSQDVTSPDANSRDRSPADLAPVEATAPDAAGGDVCVDGSTCEDDSGETDTCPDGDCDGCSADEQCDDDNDCTQDSCEGGDCSFTFNATLCRWATCDAENIMFGVPGTSGGMERECNDSGMREVCDAACGGRGIVWDCQSCWPLTDWTVAATSWAGHEIRCGRGHDELANAGFSWRCACP